MKRHMYWYDIQYSDYGSPGRRARGAVGSPSVEDLVLVLVTAPRCLSSLTDDRNTWADAGGRVKGRLSLEDVRADVQVATLFQEQFKQRQAHVRDVVQNSHGFV